MEAPSVQSWLGTFLGSLEIHDRTRCVTTMSSQELVSHPYSHFHVNAVYIDWAMFTRLNDRRIPKGCTLLRACHYWGKAQWPPPARCGMKACNIDTNAWKTLADTRNLWKQQVSQGLKSGEAAIVDKSGERRARRITCHQ